MVAKKSGPKPKRYGDMSPARQKKMKSATGRPPTGKGTGVKKKGAGVKAGARSKAPTGVNAGVNARPLRPGEYRMRWTKGKK